MSYDPTLLDVVDAMLLRAYIEGYEHGVHDEALPEIWEVDTTDWLDEVRAIFGLGEVSP